jgi:hypothetical protein
VDPHGLTVLHVSEIVDGVLKKIATDEEWSSIKTIMRSIISGSVGSFQFIPMIKTAKAESQYSRDISVSAAASQQIIDSYAASNPEEGGAESAPVEEPKDTDEITPGISEVVEDEAPAEEVSEEAEQSNVEEEPSVGDAVTNIDASDIVTTPEESTPEVDEPAKEEVQEEVVSEPEVAVPAVEEEIAPVEEVVQSTPVEETPVQEVQQVVAEVPMQSILVFSLPLLNFLLITFGCTEQSFQVAINLGFLGWDCEWWRCSTGNVKSDQFFFIVFPTFHDRTVVRIDDVFQQIFQFTFILVVRKKE